MDSRIKIKAILLSKDKNLFRSLKRALNSVSQTDLTLYDGSYGNEKSIVIKTLQDNNLGSWLWGEFRTKENALNPLIVLGIENKKSFENKHPVFLNEYDSHLYMQIPFRLKELSRVIQVLKPIHCDATRSIIVGEYAHGFEWRLIDHDLRIIKRDRASTLNNFSIVREYYSSNGDADLVKYIDNNVQKISISDDWELVAFETKKYLHCQFKAKGVNK